MTIWCCDKFLCLRYRESGEEVRKTPFSERRSHT